MSKIRGGGFVKRHKWYGFMFVLPSLLGVGLFYLIPFILSFYYTFTQGVSEVKFVGLDNFADLLQNPAFSLAAKNTLVFMAIGVPLLTLAALFLSLLMAGKLYSFPRWAMLSPIIVPVASALMGWSVIFGEGGIVNTIIGFFGGGQVNFFGEANAMPTFILIFLVKNLGYMIVIFTSSISALSREYREVFLLDSKSEIKYAFKVVIPLISPIIFFVVILSVINSFQIFREIYGFYGDIPPNTLYMLQHFMNNNFFKLNYQRLSTAAFIIVLSLSVLISVFLKYQNKSFDE